MLPVYHPPSLTANFHFQRQQGYTSLHLSSIRVATTQGLFQEASVVKGGVGWMLFDTLIPVAHQPHLSSCRGQTLLWAEILPLPPAFAVSFMTKAIGLRIISDESLTRRDVVGSSTLVNDT